MIEDPDTVKLISLIIMADKNTLQLEEANGKSYKLQLIQSKRLLIVRAARNSLESTERR